MQRAESFEKILMLESLWAGGEGDDRGWYGWMASTTQWTWVLVNFGSWLCTGSWHSVVHEVAESRTQLSDWTELNWCPLGQWCHPTISSSVVPFSSCPQSFPASGSFQMSQFFALGAQSIGVSVSASVLPMNIQDWFPLGWTGWISLLSNGLSRVFSDTTVHQFFGAQLSL